MLCRPLHGCFCMESHVYRFKWTSRHHAFVIRFNFYQFCCISENISNFKSKSTWNHSILSSMGSHLPMMQWSLPVGSSLYLPECLSINLLASMEENPLPLGIRHFATLAVIGWFFIEMHYGYIYCFVTSWSYPTMPYIVVMDMDHPFILLNDLL